MTEQNHNNNNLQQAVSDLAVIRRFIGKAQDEDQTTGSQLPTFGANIMLQGTALIFAVIGIIQEISTGHLGSRQIIESVGNPTIQVVGLVQIALILAVLAGSLYFLVYRAAKRSNREFGQYVSRNFSYLKNLSFLSDLVVKFSIVAIVILAQKPELLAPVCMLFIGDYLIQGRFFTIPLVASLLLGAGCIVAAGAMFFLGNSLLVWPFAAFSVLSAISLVQMISLRNNALQQSSK